MTPSAPPANDVTITLTPPPGFTVEGGAVVTLPALSMAPVFMVLRSDGTSRPGLYKMGFAPAVSEDIQFSGVVVGGGSVEIYTTEKGVTTHTRTHTHTITYKHTHQHAHTPLQAPWR